MIYLFVFFVFGWFGFVSKNTTQRKHKQTSKQIGVTKQGVAKSKKICRKSFLTQLENFCKSFQFWVLGFEF